MSYYQRHVFFCLNVREDAAACCGCHDAAEMQQYAKSVSYTHLTLPTTILV